MRISAWFYPIGIILFFFGLWEIALIFIQTGIIFSLLKALKNKKREKKYLEARKDLSEVSLLPEEEPPKPEKTKFQRLIKDIEEGKVPREPKVKIHKDYVEYPFRGKTFLFCNKGWKLFKDEFENDYYRIYVDNGEYLARLPNHGEAFPEFFHRWLKRHEIRELINEKGYDSEDVQVHHKDGKKENNKISNLQVLHIKEHQRIHFDGTDEEFEKWFPIFYKKYKKGFSKNS